MKIAIVGSRGFSDLERVTQFVASLPEGYIVVSGGAPGVDRAAENAAVSQGRSVRSYRVLDRHDGWFAVELWIYSPPAGWSVELVWNTRHSRSMSFRSFGKAAHYRNRLIVDDADRVMAFWDGSSPGTRGTLDYAGTQLKLMGVSFP